MLLGPKEQNASRLAQTATLSLGLRRRLRQSSLTSSSSPVTSASCRRRPLTQSPQDADDLSRLRRINGQSTSWSSQSAIMKWAPLLYERNIPWTTIFGNHDEQDTDLTSDGQIRLMQHLPLYLGESGPKSVDGHGNYVRSIRANDSDTVLTTLYFLDSHVSSVCSRAVLLLFYADVFPAQANAKKLAPWSKPGYDWIKANQCVGDSSCASSILS